MNILAGVDIGDLLGLALRASIGVQAATFALAAVGLNLHYGYTGLLNFGVVVARVIFFPSFVTIEIFDRDLAAGNEVSVEVISPKS